MTGKELFDLCSDTLFKLKMIEKFISFDEFLKTDPETSKFFILMAEKLELKRETKK